MPFVEKYSDVIWISSGQVFSRENFLNEKREIVCEKRL